jgi:hypothetical protein
MRNYSFLKVALIAVVFLSISPRGTYAWFNDPTINTPIWPRPVSQVTHKAIPGPDGGFIVAWTEEVDASTMEFDIYAMKMDSHGDPAWPSPAAVCTAASYQGFAQIASDGLGGAIIVWIDSREGWVEDYSNMNIYADRINGDGQSLWAINGIPICDASSWQIYPKAAPDGTGGAVIAWDDQRNGNSQVFSQKVNQAGQLVWIPNGVLVADIPYAPQGIPYGQGDPEIASDGFGGALVVWADFRAVSNIDVYAQRIDQTGNRAWGMEGLALARMPGEQFSAHVITSGSGGGIFSWADSRDGDGEFDVYAQKVDPTGAILWPADGLAVAQGEGSQLISAITSDGTGGVIMAWEDSRKGDDDPDIYAQRVSADGIFTWGTGGVAVATTEHLQIHPALMSDDAGGAFITWQDFYRGGTWWNVYAQHVNGSGETQWKQDGVAVSVADNTQSDPFIIPDGSGGMIILWYDNRSGISYDIYTQQVDRKGLLGGGEFKFYTADIDGNPKTVFAPGELILFRSMWTMQAPSSQGTYEAESMMSIHSGTIFRQESAIYEVSGQ